VVNSVIKKLPVKFISFTIIFFMLCMQSIAQKKELYFDYNWQPCESLKARFYCTLEKTDSGWLRNDYFISGLKLQMRALFEDSACRVHNGNSIYFFANGNVSTVGRRVHDKNEGVCLSFYSNGVMADSANFHNGIPIGNRYRWHRSGMMADSISHVNDSMDVQINWYDDGNISAAGYLLRDKMYGKWKFFHRNGKISATEIYQNGIPVSKEFYNEDGTLLSDTTKANAEAKFKGGLKGWINWLGKNLYWPAGYQFAEGDMAVVVIDLTVNEEGKVEDVEVAIPFHPEFDKIALKVVSQSPTWQPAMIHNHKVKTRFRQPVTFQQTE
jgi:TonB family protein